MDIYEFLIEATERHGTEGAYNAYGYMANSIDVENGKVIASGGKFTTFSGYGGKRSVKRERTEGVIVFPSEDNEKTLNNLLLYLCGGNDMDYAWKLGRFVKRNVVNPKGYEFSDNSLCLAISTFNWGELILDVRNISCWLGFDYVWVKVTNEKRKSCEMCKVNCRDEKFKELGKLQRGEISENEWESFLKEFNSRKPVRPRKNIPLKPLQDAGKDEKGPDPEKIARDIKELEAFLMSKNFDDLIADYSMLEPLEADEPYCFENDSFSAHIWTKMLKCDEDENKDSAASFFEADMMVYYKYGKSFRWETELAAVETSALNDYDYRKRVKTIILQTKIFLAKKGLLKENKENLTIDPHFDYERPAFIDIVLLEKPKHIYANGPFVPAERVVPCEMTEYSKRFESFVNNIAEGLENAGYGTTRRTSNRMPFAENVFGENPSLVSCHETPKVTVHIWLDTIKQELKDNRERERNGRKLIRLRSLPVMGDNFQITVDGLTDPEKHKEAITAFSELLNEIKGRNQWEKYITQ